MSDENNQGNPTPETTASSGENPNQVPQYRLNELISDRNDLREQNRMLNQTLGQLVQQSQRQNRPAQELSPEMKELQENNPTLFRKIMSQDTETKRMKAMNAQLMDSQDRLSFLMEYGDEGKKRLKEVEKLLQQERDSGNYRVNRSGILIWLNGQDRTRQSNQVPQGTQQTPQAPAPQQTTQQATAQIPPSNPVKFLNGAQAPSGFTSQAPRSREEQVAAMRERLKDTVF